MTSISIATDIAKWAIKMGALNTKVDWRGVSLDSWVKFNFKGYKFCILIRKTYDTTIVYYKLGTENKCEIEIKDATLLSIEKAISTVLEK